MRKSPVPLTLNRAPSRAGTIFSLWLWWGSGFERLIAYVKPEVSDFQAPCLEGVEMQRSSKIIDRKWPP